MSTRLAQGAVAIALLVLSGCGGFGGDEVDSRESGPTLLTKKQVERYPHGSPARTVFAWWRALQFDNAVVGARYYSTALHMTPEKLDRLLASGAGPLGLTRRPRLVEVDRAGRRATVLVLLETMVRLPNGRVDTTQVARGFNLVRARGGWRLAENLYLERQARLQRVIAKAALRRLGKTKP